MWSEPGSRRALLAALAASVVAACDFRPVYGPGGTGAALSGAVLVTAPTNDSEAFTLQRRLEDRLGPPTAPAYDLSFRVNTRTDRIAITAAQETNRFNIVGEADWQLVRLGDGTQVAAGRTQGFTSYAATGTTVATLAAERDARARLMQILSDKILADLLSAPLP